MNNFTKEELQDIYDAVMDTSIAMFEHLPSKIQAMIDNYCEHKTAYSCDYCGLTGCEDCKEAVGGELIDD